MKLALVALSCLAAGVFFAPPAISQSPTMDSLWPNDNGNSWTYTQRYESFDTNPQVVVNRVRMFFDGTTVAPSGIQAQYLREELIGGASPAIALEATVPGPLLQRLWVARPDLRTKILRAVNDSPCPIDAPSYIHALLLGGEFAYRKTAGEIAAWRCNLANTRSWLWLVSDLTIGNTFTLQLVPDLASDIFLRGTIASIETANEPAGAFDNCVRVDYVVDYGTSVCVDQDGNPLGTSRSQTAGHVHYAPFVGPVESLEEFTIVEATGSCAAPGDVGRVLARTSLNLADPPVPVRPTRWGSLKALYR